MKAAILYICTGKYSVLWPEFYESFEKNFLPESEKTYFVFTDTENLDFMRDNPRVIRIQQEPLKWPYSTLMRFHMFNRYANELAKYDYIFFLNANAQAVEKISANMILPNVEKKEDLVMVRHPAYRNCKPFEFPYDRNFKCHACIPYGCGKIYVQGCFIGGTAPAFLKMSKQIAGQIDVDLKKNIIALWHDESYLNKYVLLHGHYRLLSPQFSSPIKSDTTIIHMRPKENYFDVANVKSNPKTTELSSWNAAWNHYWYTTASRKKAFFCDVRYMGKVNLLHKLAWMAKSILKIYFHK